jgi:tetratricopeptide (TPR) repeat protein
VSRRLRGALPLLALLLATAAAYLPSIDGEFVFDDAGLLQDPLLRAPTDHGLADWLGPRRLGTLTFALNYLTVGADTRGWHLTNVLIHLAVVLLAWAVSRSTLARAGLAEPSGPALAVAALFALHPLQTEAVAYLSQRAEALAAGFFLLALLLLLRRDEAGTPARRAALLAGAFLAQAAGAWTKPMVATLPIAWLLHAGILPPPGEEPPGFLRRIRARLLPAAPLIALSIGSALWELAAVRGSGHAGFEVNDLGPVAYVATQFRVVPTYLRLAIWPAGQCADWAFPPSRGFADWRALAGALFLGAVIAGATWLGARARTQTGDGAAAARAATFGVLFFLTTLAPSSSVVPLKDPLAEHRVYLGLLGLCLAAVAGGAWALRRWPGARGATLRWTLSIALCSLLAAATASRASVWSSDETLWQDVVKKAPGGARGHLNLGVVHATKGRHREALAEYEQAAQRRGDHTVPDPILAEKVLDSLAALGRLEEARQVALAELERSQGSADAIGLVVRVEFVTGRFDAAAAAALRALELDPGHGAALKFLGMIRARRGDWGSARALLRDGAARDPSDTQVQWELGRAEEATGNVDAACLAYRRAATEPGLPAMGARASSSLRSLGCR